MKPTLRVKEIYFSLQGESTRAGLPCAFVRLTGCDLRCAYCDTEYAFSGGEDLSISQILDQVEKFSTSLVLITGGEPLLQEPVHALMTALADQGKTVLLETSGAHNISKCDPRVIRIMDLKCPSSGEVERNLWSNLDHLKKQDEVKFVIQDREDFLWAQDIVRKRRLAEKSQVLYSAVWEKLDLKTLAEWIKTDPLPVKLQPQLHKLLWGSTASI